LSEALFAKRTLVISDFREVLLLPNANLHRLEVMGVRACVIAPLLREASHPAFLAVTQRAPRVWTDDEIALIEETAERTGLAVARARAETSLRESDRRKDEFLATLAHELRNPLAPIRHGVQILRLASNDAQTTVKTLGMMERQLTHITRLIDDLLDVSRITRGAVALRKEQLALHGVFDSAIESVRHLIETGRHALTMHVPYEALYVVADPTRLSQVLGNLIHNAAKYTPEGGKIDLFADRVENDVVIRVQDTGVGIPADMLSHVFDMFAQVGGSSLERSQGGLGIGLSISRQLVEMHGGSIHAASAGLGLGATFTVTLPLASERSTNVREIASPALQRSVSSQRVLVVDDNVVAADTFASMLELFGYHVSTVYTGIDALVVAKEVRPTHIFCDIGMPGMNGYELAQRFRADRSLLPARLVAVTGWGSEEDKRRALDAGFDFHLAKPVDWAAVEELLVDD
jgi:signal transduction histidine kinase/CheY-like chemotaxis protein